LLLGVIAGLAASCGHHEKEWGTPYTGYVPPGQVPPALEEIGQRAVNIIDLAASDAWPQVLANVQGISDRWYDYRHPTIEPTSYPRPAESLLYGQLDTALARLKEAAAARNAPATMRAANDVDAATIDLVEFFHPAVPPDLHRLAVQERSILLDAWSGALDPAADTLAEVRHTWYRVRPKVVYYSSEEAALAFDYAIADQQTALNANEPIRLADSAGIALITIQEMEQFSY
jgi:hypothetical protein